MNKTPNCPKCKVPMVARKGKYGDFFGCQNFPACDITSRSRHLMGQNSTFMFKEEGLLPGDFNTRKG